MKLWWQLPKNCLLFIRIARINFQIKTKLCSRPLKWPCPIKSYGKIYILLMWYTLDFPPNLPLTQFIAKYFLHTLHLIAFQIFVLSSVFFLFQYTSIQIFKYPPNFHQRMSRNSVTWQKEYIKMVCRFFKLLLTNFLQRRWFRFFLMNSSLSGNKGYGCLKENLFYTFALKTN